MGKRLGVMVSLITITLICSGCSRAVINEDKKIIEAMKVEKVKIEESNQIINTENKKLKDKIDSLEEENRRIEASLMKYENNNNQLKIHNRDLEKELKRIKVWNRYKAENIKDRTIDDEIIKATFYKILENDPKPAELALFYESYFDEIEDKNIRTELLYEVHKCFSKWEVIYIKEFEKYGDESYEYLESNNEEIDNIKNTKLRELIFETKYFGYVTEYVEESISLEYDRSYLLTKYGEIINDEFRLYLELELMATTYGTWHTEEKSLEQLKIIEKIKEEYPNSNFQLQSGMNINEYKKELLRQLENVGLWDTYG